MQVQGIEPARIRRLNDKPQAGGRYVLYWMQQSQRAECNHALEYAIDRANRLGQGVVVGFGLTADYPEANLRHFTFMLEGLQETAAALAKRGIAMVVRTGSPPQVALELGGKASLIVCDCGYLRHQRQWRDAVARQARCPVIQVESDVIVPVETAADKAQIGARTLRPKIHRWLPAFLKTLAPVPVTVPALDIAMAGVDLGNIDAVLNGLAIDRRIGPVGRFFKGGTSEAKRRFAEFVAHRLTRYADHHNQPQTDDVSRMGPYLHFGQISTLYLAHEAMRAPAAQAARDAFIEELVVRRELACNFTHYTADYDAYGAIPGWARQSLDEHCRDKRPHVYTAGQLEGARTHDAYWNAAMREMVCTGFMHNYMRMYWGKKILEWSPTPQQAHALTLKLNNNYFLDGRDPNSYAGVAWIYGVHDRAWPSRPIFGKVRTMMASGLERKCDIQAYVAKVDALCRDGDMAESRQPLDTETIDQPPNPTIRNQSKRRGSQSKSGSKS